MHKATKQAVESGSKVAFRNGKTIETAEELEDYPEAIVNSQRQYHQGLSDEDRLYLRNEQQQQLSAAVGEFKAMATNDAFASSFSPFDILWGLFAVLTAWRLGAMERG